MEKGVLGKAKSIGFDSVNKLEKEYIDETGRKWDVYEAVSNSDESAFGLPIFLLTSGNDLKIADDDETFQIMCVPA